VFWRETQTFTTEESRLQILCDHWDHNSIQETRKGLFFYLNKNKNGIGI
jgi:hypothetical protein